MNHLFLAAALALLPAAASDECRIVRNEYSFMRAECSNLRVNAYQTPSADKPQQPIEQHQQQRLRDLKMQLHQQIQQLYSTSYHGIYQPESRSTGF
jgi:hypothetical protein